MSKINLVLADEDIFFSQSFSRYILEHNGTFEITSYTKTEFLMDALDNGNIDILLIVEKMLTDEIKFKLTNCLILILDDVSKDAEPYAHVNKYQKTESILKEITFKYAESKGDQSFLASKGEGANIISVYSPIGGSGKTTVAMSLAGALVKRGYGVIYFSMERFGSEDCYMDVTSGEGLSEIFLKLKNGSNGLSFEIMKRLVTDESGIQYLLPPESAMEFSEMSCEEMHSLIEQMANCDGVDYLIIDTPSEFNEMILNVLKMSSCVALIAEETPSGISKIRKFVRELSIFAELKLIYDRFLPIVNKTSGRNASQAVQQVLGEKPAVGVIPYMNVSGLSSVKQLSAAIDDYIVEIIRFVVGR